MITVPPSQRLGLASLFAEHIGLRTCLDGVLEGHFGDARADSAKNACVACLSIGPFTFLGGDAAHPVADQLIERLSDFRVILVPDPHWQSKITAWENSETSMVERHAFSSDHLHRSHLEALASSLVYNSLS